MFGSLCYAHKQIRDKDKFVSRSRKCVFVGYSFGKKGWQLYDLETNEFFVSRDVIFKECDFPFSIKSQPDSPSRIVVELCDEDSLMEELGNVENRGSVVDKHEDEIEIEIQDISPADLDGAILEVGPILSTSDPAVVAPEDSVDRVVVNQPERELG